MRFLGKFLFIAVLVACPARAEQSVPVRIAIVDTGLSRLPSEIANIPLESYDARTARRQLSAIRISNSGPASQHGLWVAGVLARHVNVPIAILSYRIDNECSGDFCEMSQASLANAIDAALEARADIIQVSSYGKMGTDVDRAIARAQQRGVAVVFCAGNEGGVTPLIAMARKYPQTVHVVGALNSRGRHASYSAHGGREANLVQWRRGTGLQTWDANGSRRMVTGTSFAASVYSADLAAAIHNNTRQQANPVIFAAAPVPQIPGRNRDVTVASLPSSAKSAATVTPQVEARQVEVRQVIQREIAAVRVAVAAPTAIESEISSKDRVLLASAGEMAIEALTPEEAAQVPHSRIIPMDDQPAPPIVIAIAAPVTAAEPPAAPTYSRAIPPGRD